MPHNTNVPLPAKNPTSLADDLRTHLRVVHKNEAADQLDEAEALDQHHHEHFGPGGLRNHEHTPVIRAALRAEELPFGGLRAQVVRAKGNRATVVDANVYTLTELFAGYDNQRRHLDSMTRMRDVAYADLDALKKKLRDSEGDRDDLRERLKKLDILCANLETRLREMTAHRDSLDTDLVNEYTKNQELKTELANTRSNYEQAERLYNKTLIERDRAHKERDEAREELRSAQALNANLNSDQDRLEKLLNKALVERDAAREELDKARRELKSTKSFMIGYTGNDSSAALAQMTAQRDALAEDVAKEYAKRVQLENDGKSWREEVKRLRLRNHTLTQENTALKVKVVGLEGANHELEREQKYTEQHKALIGPVVAAATDLLVSLPTEPDEDIETSHDATTELLNLALTVVRLLTQED